MNIPTQDCSSPLPIEAFGSLKPSSKLEMGQKSRSSNIKKRRKILSLELNNAMSSLKPDSASFFLSDHYEVDRILGSGTYASVKLAQDKTTSREYAIKISRKQNSRTMLKSEYELLKKLNHESIVKPVKFEDNDKRNESYLIMEYFEGVDMNKFAQERGRLTLEELKTIGSQLISAISYLHKENIAHRDLKPENVLINKDLQIKLIDFNISKETKKAKGEEAKFKCRFYTQISSPLYAAPEIRQMACYTESVDIWGIGVILFTLLFGPIEDFKKESDSDFESNSELLSNAIGSDCFLPEEIKDFLTSLLVEDPLLRPTAEELETSDVLNNHV